MPTANEKLRAAQNRASQEYATRIQQQTEAAAKESNEFERLLRQFGDEEARIVELFDHANWSKATLAVEVVPKWGINWPVTRAEIPVLTEKPIRLWCRYTGNSLGHSCRVRSDWISGSNHYGHYRVAVSSDGCLVLHPEHVNGSRGWRIHAFIRRYDCIVDNKDLEYLVWYLQRIDAVPPAYR